jgi:hypothetical protein
MTQTLLYRGGSYENYTKMIENGFDLSKIGEGWGLTLGPGVYLSRSRDEALSYARDGKHVLEIPVENLNSFKLEKAYRVDSSKHRRKLEEITQKAKDEGYNSLESWDGFETIIFPEFAQIILWELAEIIGVEP